jgi:hypothetical protein
MTSNQNRTSASLFITLILIALPLGAQAEIWEPVNGADKLTALFSDTVQTAELGGGSMAIANYNADGTGELKAWNDTFEREWKVDDDELICIKIDNRFQCWRIEKNSEKSNEYRGTKVETGESVIFVVTNQEAKLSAGSPRTNSGGAAEPSAEEMAQKLANPTNPIMTIGNNFDYVTFQGDLPGAEDESSFRYLFQTVFPFKLADGKGTVFFRPAVPIFFNEPVPDGLGSFSSEGTDLGDIGFDLSYGQTSKSGWLYGGGVVGTLPTATNDQLGKDKWALGPEFLFGKVARWGAVMGLFTHQWDVAGSGDAKINNSALTYIYAFSLGGGWQVAASPVITYNHEAASDNKLSLPLGIGIAKTSVIKGRPWKFQLQYWNYVETNDAFGPEHQIRLSVSPVVSAPWNAD